MDARFEQSRKFRQQEKLAVESIKGGDPFDSNLYYPLPRKGEKGIIINRLIVMWYQPAQTMPELYTGILPADHWDFRAYCAIHYMKNAVQENVVVFCRHATAEYYAKAGLPIKADDYPCEYCKSGVKYTHRFLMQVFDFDKLRGDRKLDREEIHVHKQGFIAPATVGDALYEKSDAGNEFANVKVVRVKKDTTGTQVNSTEYTTEIEGYEEPEFKDPEFMNFLNDQASMVNLVKDEFIVFTSAHVRTRGKSNNAPAGAPVQAGPVQAPATQGQPVGVTPAPGAGNTQPGAGVNPGVRKVSWKAQG